ncbi:tyrosine-type recombinase/integrase [Lacipirellula limnantheis]|nr:tyrosine-type recombinase/integrase [Lacipirellula limnantheis]
MFRKGKAKTYWVRFWCNGADHKFSLKTRYKNEALKKVTEIAAQVEAGNYQKIALEPEQALAMSDGVQQYIRYLQSEGRAPKTWGRYQGELKRFAEFTATHGATRMDAITMLHLDAYRDHRRQSRKPRTVHHESVVIKQFFSWCRRRNLIAINPIAEYELQKPRPAKMPKPTIEHVRQILGVAAEPRMTQYAVLAFTGMRVSEMQHLLLSDVDLEGNWLSIVSRAGARTKTQMDWRVPIHPILRELLVALPQSHRKWLFTAGPSSKFPQGGNWMNVKTINDDFKALLKTLEIPAGRDQDGFTIHSLRGFFKSHCVNHGVPREVVDSWQGHTMRATASDMYYCLPDDVSQDWMAKVPFSLE